MLQLLEHFSRTYERGGVHYVEYRHDAWRRCSFNRIRNRSRTLHLRTLLQRSVDVAGALTFYQPANRIPQRLWQNEAPHSSSGCTGFSFVFIMLSILRNKHRHLTVDLAQNQFFVNDSSL